MYHHGETLKLTHYDEIKKRAHDSQLVRAKENLKLSQVYSIDVRVLFDPQTPKK